MLESLKLGAKPLHVVPHVHWDREWYRPFASYHWRLVKALDQVLENDWPYFLLDGQTVALDDYLAVRPDQEPRIAAKARAGKLGLGPWYVLVDEFLVSGESLIRNLHLGRRAMARFGADPGSAVGYLPDMFGHIAQMPQILAGFGLDWAVVWRGASLETDARAPRFVWRAPDGSAVKTAWLPLGYYQPLFSAPYSPAERLAQAETYVAPFAAADAAWLLAGADHMVPLPDLASRLAELNAGLPGWHAAIVPLKQAIGGQEPAFTLEGELRDPSRAYLLPGVLSSRPWIKQENVACQDLLERRVEPALALRWALAPEVPYPQGLLDHAWRELLKNHPHDSICGCSVDEVHEEMRPRFSAARQIGQGLLEEALGVSRRPAATPSVVLFNPAGAAIQDAPVRLVVRVPLDGAPEALELVGPDGAPWPTAVLASEDLEVFEAELDLVPDWFKVRRFTLETRASLPALGSVTLRARAAEAAAGAPAPAAPESAAIENELIRLAAEDGKLVLTDRRTGRRLADWLRFVDEADAGDTYNFSPIEGDALLPSRLEEAAAEAGLAPDEKHLTARFTLNAPLALSADRRSRSAERAPLILTARFTLRASSPTIGIVLTLPEHRHQDHRLRAVFRAPAGPEARVWSESPFAMLERQLVEPPALPAPKGTESVMPEFPHGGLVMAAGEAASGAIFAPGLPEASRLPDGGIALTLLRAVGWLSRDDLRTRGGGAGPRFETPLAQCPGPQRFELAYRLGDSPRLGAVLADYERWRHPVVSLEGAGLPGAGLSAPFELGHPALMLSALKRSEDGTALVLRVFNPTPEPIAGALQVHLPHARVVAARLDETPERTVGTGRVSYQLRPYGIQTWRIER